MPCPLGLQVLEDGAAVAPDDRAACRFGEMGGQQDGVGVGEGLDEMPAGSQAGFDIIVGTLYEKDKAPFFLKVMQGGKTK